MLSDEWLSRYGLLENFNASVTRTGTGTGTHTGTGTWTTGVTAIALCTSCSRAKNIKNFPLKFSIFTGEKKSLYIAWASFRNESARELMCLA